ncbi:hypothetical protein F4824DRAFT_323886 [Ustulina deusta]|nr:hypothetical protein F4824DRAFT_323886 [Ustulina deusta]
MSPSPRFRGNNLGHKTSLPTNRLKTKPMVILTKFSSGRGAAAAAQPDWTTATTRSRAMAMSVSLPTGAVVAAPTKVPATLCRYGSRIVAILASALRLASHCQQLLSRVLLSLCLRAALLASGLLGLSQSVVQTCQATTRLSRQATWMLWDSTHTRRLRKKIEFEFFTLILGAGGNNLCLVIFWPGWGVLGLAVLALSAWHGG